MIRVIDYLPEHLAQIELRACHKGERPSEITSSAITFMAGDEPVAIIAWYFITPKVVHVCGLLSDKVKKHRLSFHKKVRTMLAGAFGAVGLQRIQISVVVGFEAGWAWAESLGFQYEGIMCKYGPNGEDHLLFARTVR